MAGVIMIVMTLIVKIIITTLQLFDCHDDIDNENDQDYYQSDEGEDDLFDDMMATAMY